MNPFKRKKNEKKEKKFDTVNEKNYKDFLTEISKAIDNSFNGQESITLQQVFEKEVSTWLNNTIFAGKKLDPNAIKFGICLGLKESLRKINESEQKAKVTYIN